MRVEQPSNSWAFLEFSPKVIIIVEGKHRKQTNCHPQVHLYPFEVFAVAVLTNDDNFAQCQDTTIGRLHHCDQCTQNDLFRLVGVRVSQQVHEGGNDDHIDGVMIAFSQGDYVDEEQPSHPPITRHFVFVFICYVPQKQDSQTDLEYACVRAGQTLHNEYKYYYIITIPNHATEFIYICSLFTSSSLCPYSDCEAGL